MVGCGGEAPGASGTAVRLLFPDTLSSKVGEPKKKLDKQMTDAFYEIGEWGSKKKCRGTPQRSLVLKGSLTAASGGRKARWPAGWGGAKG